jgi:hypothetical protein
MNKYFFARLKNNIEHLKKNSVYFVDQTNANKIGERNADFIDFDTIPKYSNQEILFIVRSGGIGDLIAMSILQEVAPKTIVLTQKKHFPVLKLWNKEPIMRHFEEPLFEANNINDFTNKLKRFGTLFGEGIIEKGSSKNWYEIFSNSVGKELIAGSPIIKKYVGFEIDACLIVSKSTSVNRSANEIEFRKIALKYFDVVDIAHDQKWTTQQYIEALAKYKFVISVDTSAIHIREGFKLPALGLYGAFSKDSRTKYYKHVKCIDVKNECLLSPCFNHSQKPCSENKGTNFAPCFTNYEHIESELKEYLNQLNG